MMFFTASTDNNQSGEDAADQKHAIILDQFYFSFVKFNFLSSFKY